MATATIAGKQIVSPKRPNLVDYATTCAAFSWKKARDELDGLPSGRGLNIAYEAVDRHARGARRNKVAMRFLSEGGAGWDYTYGDLSAASNRFARVLQKLGVGKGDRVFALSGRIPELYIAALGTLKNRSVFCPLFSAFGSEPIRARVTIGEPKVLVTTASLYRKKIAAVREHLPFLEHILIVGSKYDTQPIPGTLSLGELLAEASDEFEIPPTDPEDPALLHFTSGTTGTPKGALHVHEAVVAHHITGKYALDFHDDDIFWCTADPGWVTGTSYGIISPLTNGVTSIIDEAEFDPQRWYSILQDQKVSIWYTAPTAIRTLMRVGTDLVHEYTLP
ncbi:MAG TPA: AMP-binding protein, partial [Pirellulales bacterium]|nr:AMP-binding protein [Pirellulales bacterium]